MRASRCKAALSGAFVLSAITACAHSGSSVEGRLASGGGYLGDWDFYPTVCEGQGDIEGVALAEEGTGKRRVMLLDRAGGKGTKRQHLELHVDGETPNGNMDILLGDSRCVTTSLRREGETYTGTVEVDCGTGEGGRVRGKVTFANCSTPPSLRRGRT